MDPAHQQQQNPPVAAPHQQQPQQQPPVPQPGYGYPPYGQPPPPGAPGQYPPAPQGQAPPQGQYPPQGYYMPPGQYPPQAAYYPPPVQYPAGAPGQVPPPAGQPQPYPAPQQQPYGALPTGQYPHQPAAGQYPPAVGSNPQPAGYRAPVGTQNTNLPSLGYDASHIATGDMSEEARKIKKAFGSFNTDEAKLIQVLSKPDAAHMALLRKTYRHDIGKNLEDTIAEKVKRDFGETLLALVRGPLKNDIIYLHNALQATPALAGTGPTPTSPAILINDVLLRRSNADITAIKAAFKETYKSDLSTRLANCPAISGPHHTLFVQVLKAQRTDDESRPLDHALVEADATKLDSAPKNIDPGCAHETELVHLLASRSDAHLRAVAAALAATRPAFRDGTLTLEKKVKAIWARADRKGLRHSALHIVRGALDGQGLEARLLRKCMKGLGTRDSLLIARVVRLHWQRERGRVAEVKAAYRRLYEKRLVDVVEKETGGDYEKLLVALLDG
ncbi:annexin [Histoplasma capsulatum G186AR]|uniref:Annexin n=2 Tax=Ajellomyces capsulatus TaxID=5037 RepID=C0NSG5_AJECG|nr:annexin [Histoplasma capsulatum G186AR]EEH05831.1 annexin [Histoplasma capsulatum G186AR]KAG5300000.1 annexin [Histoplasma capsulatum]QSS67371.1 annexin [Histoplasma capsulatum G186AR]